MKRPSRAARRDRRGRLQRARGRLRAEQARRPRHDLRERTPRSAAWPGASNVDGTRLEKFYHHWFTNDEHIPSSSRSWAQAIRSCSDRRSTGMYYANRLLRLSTPLDVLRFTPLAVPRPDPPRPARAARAPRRTTGGSSEEKTAAEWLRRAGRRHRLPRRVGAAAARQVRRLRRRESPRSGSGTSSSCAAAAAAQGGEEQLAYYRGRLRRAGRQMARLIVEAGGADPTETRVERCRARRPRGGVVAAATTIDADAVLATPALPIVADLLAPHASAEPTSRSLRRIEYLGQRLPGPRARSQPLDHLLAERQRPDVPLRRRRSSTPTSSRKPPTAGVTSSTCRATCRRRSALRDERTTNLLAFALPHLAAHVSGVRARSGCSSCHVWRARYAQPVVERRYSRLIPAHRDTAARAVPVRRWRRSIPRIAAPTTPCARAAAWRGSWRRGWPRDRRGRRWAFGRRRRRRRAGRSGCSGRSGLA